MHDDSFKYRPRFADAEEYCYIGPFIANIREKLGLTQTQVSTEIGFSIQSISRFENNKTNPISVMGKCYIEYILDLLGMDLTEVTDWFDQFVDAIRNQE